MVFRTSKHVAIVASIPLVAGALAAVPGAVAGSAAAACAPSVVASTTQANVAKKPHVHLGKPVVTKVRKRYVAKVAVTSSQASIVESVTETICPDGTAGTAASATQSAPGTSVASSSASAGGRTKAAATKAAKAKAKKLAKKLVKKGSTASGRAAALAKAVAVATPVATKAAHDALYDSDVVYVSVTPTSDPSVSTYHVSSTPLAVSTKLSQAANGDLTLTVPAGFDPFGTATTSLACVKRAPAWPTAFLFDASSVASPYLLSLPSSGDMAGYMIGAIDGVSTSGSSSAVGDSVWGAGRIDPSATSLVSGYFYDSSSPTKPYAGQMVCWQPEADAPSTSYTLTMSAPIVGTQVGAPDTNGLQHVTGGQSIKLRTMS